MLMNFNSNKQDKINYVLLVDFLQMVYVPQPRHFSHFVKVVVYKWRKSDKRKCDFTKGNFQ